MSHLPARSVREVPDAPGEYEVMRSSDAEMDSDEEAMFEFDSDTEAREYQRGQAALIEELTAKKAKEDAKPIAPTPALPSNASSSEIAAAAAAANPGVGGVATVVQVTPAVSADGTVDIALNVFDRYVPHLGQNKAADMMAAAGMPNGATAPAVASSSNASAVSSKMQTGDSDSSDSSDDDEEENVTGGALVLTGDRAKDHSTLAALMGSKDAAMEDSSSDDEDDAEDIALRAQAASLEDIGSDEEADHATGKVSGVYTKNELQPHQIPPPQEFEVAPDAVVEEIGYFVSCVDRLLVLESVVGRPKVLDIGSAICTADRKPVGRVEEVIGLVSEPYYAIRLCASFDASTLPDPLGDDDSGMDGARVTMSFVPSLSTFAQADSRPGTDASNLHDEEIPEDEQEFSDDEAEAEAKAEKKQKLKQKQAEKKRQAAAADTGALPGAVTQRSTFKAKRTSGGQPAQAQAPSAAARGPASPQSVAGAASTPAAPQQFVSPQAGQGLLPMPGSAPPAAYPPYAQSPAFAMPGYPPAPYGYPPQNQQAAYAHYQQQQAAYAQYYAQNPHAGGYGAYPAQPQPQAMTVPGGVPGGFAGWGAQNLAMTAPPQQQPQPYPYPYPNPYGPYPPQYAYPTQAPPQTTPMPQPPKQ